MFQSCVTLEDNWKPSYRNWMWDLSALRDGKLGSWTSGSLKGLYQQKTNLTQPFSLYIYFWELMTFLALNFLSCLAEEPSLVWILCGWQLVCQYIAEISRLVAQDSGTYQTWLSCFLALLVRKVFLFSLFWFYCGGHEGQPMSNYRFGSVSPKYQKIDVSAMVSAGLSFHLSPSIGVSFCFLSCVSWLWPVFFVSHCIPCFTLGGLELGPSSSYFPKYLSLWSSPVLTCLLIAACFCCAWHCFIIISSFILVYINLNDLGSVAAIARLPKHVHVCNSR